MHLNFIEPKSSTIHSCGIHMFIHRITCSHTHDNPREKDLIPNDFIHTNFKVTYNPNISPIQSTNIYTTIHSNIKRNTL